MGWYQNIGHILKQRRLLSVFVSNSLPPSRTTDATNPQLVRLSKKHVRDFIAWSGGCSDEWGEQIPPTLFPYWMMTSFAPCLSGRDLPLSRLLNGGCRVKQFEPIMVNEDFQVQSSFDSFEVHDHFKMLSFRSETRHQDEALLLESTVRLWIPNPSRAMGTKKVTELRPTGDLLGSTIAGKQYGWAFACLTGDLNPIHWLRLWARAFGFRACMQHGFGTLAKCYEIMLKTNRSKRSALEGGVSFRSPVPLPSTARLYWENHNVSLWVDGANKPSLVGTIK